MDEVADDLEREGYAFGAAVLSSASISAVDSGERIFFLAEADNMGWEISSLNGSSAKAVLDIEEGKDGSSQFAGGSSSRVLSFQDIQWRKYPNGKLKAIKPGICLLDDGHPDLIPIMHAFGNAINPELAAKFIRCCP